ncbi:tyrosine--tRNA ligase [Clostridium intestinale]|jgi:tyrosyl-tRNA synthetase|uniref:Tyrosine--tRNA ligase n=1 Tax=Clostridium intestinale URNW TaxID=1294142 RepID=U2MZC0_9CLOT|nr:tyrosine--tRNA ligase [Clostridium intestinale]ERK28572.1 tyrosyl-tRNA ligase [Clostridium intestinale URNW]
MKSIEEQLKIIMKGVDEAVGKDELKEKLETGKVLTVKLGLDPSAPDIHLGHTVVLRKIKQLQDLGHKAVIIIGDFTGMIGDPTGKSKTRKQLTKEQVIENAKTYEKQIFKVLDKSKTELRFNSEWLSKLNFEDVIKLAATTTVARMLEREDFKKRYTQYEPIGIHEFFYPLMQAYDSVEIKADIELGGTDQRFNLLMGRTLQKEYKQDSQTTIFMPLLEGLDGIEKMSKSLGNYIGIDEPSKVMYEKAMSIPDELIIKYYELVTDVHPDDIQLIKKSLEEGENPRNIKMKLSKEIVKLYHGEQEANEAEERFIEIFQKGNIPNDILTVKAASNEFDLMKILTENSLVQSKKEVRRLIEQGGIKINDIRILELENIKLDEEMIIQIGKKKFIKIIIED